MQSRTLDYNSIHTLTNVLAQKVGDNYDYIVGVGRGGLIPAAMTAYRLGKKVLAFNINTYSNQEKKRTYEIYQTFDNIACKADGASFLVVDDICDTGHTFDVMRGYFSEDKKFRFTFSSVLVKQGSEDKVDYYSLVVPSNIWIDFPWEKENMF